MRALLASVLAAAALAAAAAPASAAGFGCASSAGRLTVLGQAVEPVKAVTGAVACGSETKTLTSPDLGLGVGAATLVAATEVFPVQQSVLASGGMADLRVLSLPSLPITLPVPAVPDAAKAAIAAARSTTVDLSGIKALIPTLPVDLVTNLVTTLTTNLPEVLSLAPAAPLTAIPTIPLQVGPSAGLSVPAAPLLPTNLRTDLPTNLPTSFVKDAADSALDTDAEVADANAKNAAANAANGAANTANAAANTANATVNTLITAANTAIGAVNAVGSVSLLNLATVNALITTANTAITTANTAISGVAATNDAAHTAGLDAIAANIAANALNAAINAIHAAINVANTATNAANAAANALRDAIPGSVGVDGATGLASLLDALLPSGKLPDLELLHVKGAMAYANGSCQSGSPVVGGSSAVSGIDVLGQSVSGQVVDRVLGLIDTASIDPSDVPLPGIDLGLTPAQQSLIDSVPAAHNALTNLLDTVRSTIRSALDGLAPVKVLDPTVAQVKVTPGGQVKTATSVVQQALRVAVTIAGQTVVDGVLGEARTTSAGVSCSQPVVDAAKDAVQGGVAGEVAQGKVNLPGFQAPIDTSTPEGAALQCSKRRLVLVDVLERGGRVKLNGVADPALAGRSVAIVFGATGRTVAHARVDRDGSFATTAPLPPAALRATNAARYTAKLGSEESTNLKLQRRMVIDSMKAEGRRVTITGRVLPPLGRPLQAISVVRRVSCTEEKVERRIHPAPDGHFRVTVVAPKGLGTVVYRMITRVRFSATGTGLFKTYTLPRAVDLG